MQHWSTTLTNFFVGLGLPEPVAMAIAFIIGATALAIFAPTLALGLIWITRKIISRIQDRIGPNRTGPFGLFQTVADAAKLLSKEDISPTDADRVAYNLAPILSVFGVIMSTAVIAFAPGIIGADLHVGVLFLVALGSLSILSALMAGWSSNNKYALLAGFRVIAQLLSYEIPMVLAMLGPVLLAGSMRLQALSEFQSLEIAGFNIGLGWTAFIMPAVFLIYFISALAEGEQTPFDLLEAESELIAGFHIEYSGMKFGMFYVAEFLHAFTIGVLTAILFMGGWRGPFAEDVPLLGFVYLMIKSLVAYVVLIWVRMTLPRLRIDQLLDFNWKFLVPLSLVNLLVVAFVWKVVPDTDQISNLGDAIVPTLVLLVVNIAMIAVVGAILRERGRRERQRIEARMTAAKPAAAGD